MRSLAMVGRAQAPVTAMAGCAMAPWFIVPWFIVPWFMAP